MIKNKKMFLFMTLLILMVGISVVSATDSTDDASDVSTISSDVSTTTHTDTSSSVSSDSSSSSSSNSVSSDSSDGSSISHVATTSSSSMSSQKADTTTSDSSSSSHESTQSSTSSDTKTVSSSTNSSSVSNSDNKDIKTQEGTSTNTSAKENSNTNINTIATSSSDSNIEKMTYLVNNNTFDQCFDQNGILNISEGSAIVFSGDVERNKSYVIDKAVEIEGSGHTFKLLSNESSLNIVSGGANTNITHLNFENVQIFVNETENVTFDRINYTVTSTTMGWGVGCFAIRDGSVNITVENSNFTVSDNGGHSIIALTLAENCTITNNTITASGQVGNILYLNTYNAKNGTKVTENKNNVISNNKITGPSTPLAICYAVVISGSSNKIINNTVDYGGYAITTSWVGNYSNETGDNPENHNLSNYGNQLINNTVTSKGRVLVSNNTIMENNSFSGLTRINGNTSCNNNNFTNLTVYGEGSNITNNLVSYNSSIYGSNIYWNNTYSMYLVVYGSNNYFSDSFIPFFVFASNSSNNRAVNNSINSYKDSGTNNTNTPKSTIQESEELIISDIVVTDVFGKYNDSVQLTAVITDTEGVPVNEGQVQFKLNGVTLKNEDGNNILVNVKNGIATLDYKLTNNPGTYNISAVYSGSDQYQSSRTENDATLTVENRVANLTIASKSNNLKSGERLLITVVVSDNNKYVSDGVVIYKLNGVTLKDENGANLQSTLSKGVATLEYTIPVDMAGKDYTLTAVYSGKNFDRAEMNATLTLIKSNVTAVISPSIIDQGENATVSVTLFDQNGNQLERSTKVTIKANGKTILNTETVNGVLNTTIPTDTFKNPYYNLTVIFGENSAYNELRLNTTLVVESNNNVADLKTQLKGDTSYEVSSYQELLSTINEIKSSGTSDTNYIINVKNDTSNSFEITDTITWGDSDQSATNLTINANGVTFNAGDDDNNNKFIKISQGFTLNLNDVIITNVTPSFFDNDGAITNNGNLTLTNSVITNTTLGQMATTGAIYNSGEMTLTNVEISNTSPDLTMNGAALYNTGNASISYLKIENTTKTSMLFSGVIYNLGNMNITYSNITCLNATIYVDDDGFTQNARYDVAVKNTGNISIENSNITSYRENVINNTGSMSLNSNNITAYANVTAGETRIYSPIIDESLTSTDGIKFIINGVSYDSELDNSSHKLYTKYTYNDIGINDTVNIEDSNDNIVTVYVSSIQSNTSITLNTSQSIYPRDTTSIDVNGVLSSEYYPIANQEVTISLNGVDTVTVTTDNDGSFSHTFELTDTNHVMGVENQNNVTAIFNSNNNIYYSSNQTTTFNIRNTISLNQTTFDVYSYDELYSTIETIKIADNEENFTINLHENVTIGAYDITNKINWDNMSSIPNNITINGNGVVLTGTNNNGFLSVTEGYSITIKDLTINNISQSHVIDNNGILNISNITINNLNSSSAINNNGVLYLSDSKLTNSTGDQSFISNQGNATISNTNITLLDFNSSSAIYNGGNLNITSSIITNGTISNTGNISLDSNIFDYRNPNKYIIDNKPSISSNTGIIVEMNNNTLIDEINGTCGVIIITSPIMNPNLSSDEEVTFTITSENGTSIVETAKKNDNNEVQLNYDFQSGGTYTVTINYPSYPNNNITYIVIINKLATSITVEKINDSHLTDTILITGTLSINSNDKCDILISVNSEEFTTTTDENGKYSIEYTVDNIGVNNVTVTYPGTDKYESSTAQTTFIARTNSTILIDPIPDSTYGDTITISGSLLNINGTPAGNEEVIITINSKENITATTDVNGVYSIEYTTNTFGINNITVRHLQSDKFESSVASSTFISRINTEIVASDITCQYKDETTLVATVTTINGDLVNDGKVAFKINSVTLKDEEGNTLYAEIKNGTASLKYNITYNPGTYTITGLYYGTTSYLDSKSDNATLTVTERTVDLYLKPDLTTIKPGETITALVEVDDNGYATDSGEVIFKLNGVTLKDDNQNEIRIPVTNASAILTYEIPKNMSAKSYNLTVVYSNKNYQRTEYNSPIDIIRSDVITQVDPVYVTRSNNATLSMVLYDQDGNIIDRSTKIAVKANGKTILNSETGSGTVELTLPTDTFKNTYYNLTIVLGENSQYNKLTLDTILITQPATITSQTTSSKSVSSDGDEVTITWDNIADYFTVNNSTKYMQIIDGGSGLTPNTVYYLDLDLTGYYVDMMTTSENANGVIFYGTTTGVYENVTILFRGSNTTFANFNLTNSYLYVGSAQQEGMGYTLIENNTMTGELPNSGGAQVDYPIYLGYESNTYYSGNDIIFRNNYVDYITTSVYIDWGTIPSANNIVFRVDGTPKTTITNNTILIDSTKDDGNPAGFPTAYGIEINNGVGIKESVFSNNTFQMNGVGWLYALLINTNGLTVTGNNITVVSEHYTCGIKVGSGSQNNVIENNIINCTSSEGYNDTVEFVVYDIYLENYGYYGGSYTTQNVTAFNKIINNTIIGEGYNVYGIEGFGIDYLDVINNTFLISGTEPEGIGLIGTHINITGNNFTSIGIFNGTGSSADYLKPMTLGIQLLYSKDSQSSITNNNINVTTGRGIYLESGNVNIDNNNITITNYTYSIELHEDNINVTNNYLKTPTLRGDNSVMDNGTNNYIANNKPDKIETTVIFDNILATYLNETITISGTLIDEENNPLSNTTITVVINNNNPVELITDSNGKFSINYTTDTLGINNITVTFAGDNNYESSITTATFNIRQNSTITVSDITAKYRDTIQLTATVLDINGNLATDGQVSFKLNGVTLRDEDGNTLFADVKNGVASLDYTITNNPKDYTITAVYQGSDNYLTSRSNEATLTVTTRQASIETYVLADDIKPGDTITITAIVIDEGYLATDGQVIFKLNGVTLKDENGDPIKVNVEHGMASLTYTIPVDYSAKDYVLTAVYSGKNYDRAEENSTLSIIKSNVTAVLDPIYITTGENAQLNITVQDYNKNTINRSIKVNIKANGKTLVSTTTENGNINIELPTETFKNPYYNITVTLGENSQYNGLTLDTILIVNNIVSNATIKESANSTNAIIE